MKIKSLGFRIQPVGNCSIEQLAERLNTSPDNRFMFRKQERRLYSSIITSNSENFLVGLFLTIRDQKKFLQLKEKNGNISIDITELDNESSPFEFNFFVIHLESGSGLFSSYHYSCSLYIFHSFLRDQYLRSLKAIETGEFVDDKVAVRGSKTKDLQLQIFYRRDNFEDAIKQLTEIKQFEYDILTPASMTSELQPISSKLTLERRQVRIKAGVSGDSLWGHIKSMAESLKNNQRFRVIGKDSTGETTLIDYLAPPDHYSEDDFDEIADHDTLNLQNVQSSSYILKLLQVFENEKALFTA